MNNHVTRASYTYASTLGCVSVFIRGELSVGGDPHE